MRRIPAARLTIGDEKPTRVPTDLYVVETGCAERFLKIGISSNVQRRLMKMQMDCPYDLRLVKSVRNGAHLEYELHGRFAADRLRGEWFRPTAELLEAITDLPDAFEAPASPSYPKNPRFAS